MALKCETSAQGPKGPAGPGDLLEGGDLHASFDATKPAACRAPPPAGSSDVIKTALAMFKRAQQPADFEECAQLFTDVIALRPNRHPYYFSRGRCFLALGQYQRALWDFSMAIRLDRSIGKHYGCRGQCLRKLGRLEESHKDYCDALLLIGQDKDGSTAGDLLYQRGIVSYELSDFTSAIADFGLAIEKKIPSVAKAFFHRGICNRKLGKIEDAIRDLKQALSLECHNHHAHNQLGLCYFEKEDNALAKQSFTQAIEIGDCDNYHSNRGMCSLRTKEFDEAIHDFTVAIQKEAKEPSYVYNRGHARYAKGDYEGALEDYGQAISLDPNNEEYLHHRGLSYQALGPDFTKEAVTAFLTALEKCPTHCPSLFHLGVVYHRDGQHQKALEVFSRVPPDQSLYDARGCVYKDIGDFTHALEDFCKAIDCGSPHCSTYESRGLCFLCMGRYQNALDDFNMALDLSKTQSSDGPNRHPKESDLYNYRGLAWAGLGNTSQAVMDLTVAIDLDKSQSTEYLSNRAQCFYDLGLYYRAENDLCRALTIDKDNPTLCCRRGLTRYTQQRYREAIADLKKSIRNSQPCERQATNYYHLGVSYANLGKHALAVPYLENAVKLAPDRPQYIHEQAKGYQMIGEHKRAVESFTRVLMFQPRNARALFRRAFSYKALKAYEDAAEDFEAAKELAPDDPRLVVNYRQLHSVACISLGLAGQEDPQIHTEGAEDGPADIHSPPHPAMDAN